jgi:hypothetical protein
MVEVRLLTTRKSTSRGNKIKIGRGFFFVTIILVAVALWSANSSVSTTEFKYSKVEPPSILTDGPVREKQATRQTDPDDPVREKQTELVHQNVPPIAIPIELNSYKYTYDHFYKIDTPWTDWSTCEPQQAFVSNCHPRPATCTQKKDDILNKHGIGNALIVTYVKSAREILQETGCAPELHDAREPLKKHAANRNGYNFQLLDYVQVPNVVVDGTNSLNSNKCVLFSITQPKEMVASKVQDIASQLREGNETQLPLVALHFRTGWSDEMQRNFNGWDALGSCADYREHFSFMAPHKAMTEIDLQGVVMDVAAAADKAFGPRKWRLYVASDAPAVRHFVRHMLESRTVGPVVWVQGSVGHNYFGGSSTTKNEKIEIAANAFVDIQVLSEADMLVSLPSKFPKASNMRSMCPQRYLELKGHPRHNLATAGSILDKALQSRISNRDDPWSPQLTEDEKNSFFDILPEGKHNGCTQDADSVRACFCLLKIGHV